MLTTVVESNPKAPFSIATKPRYRGGWNSFLWIAPFYPRYVPYNAEFQARRYHVSFFGGARGVMVIVVGIRHGDTSSNPGLIAFHIALIPLGKI